MSIVREIYEGFQRGELDRWDAIVSPDVEIYSPGMWGGRGREVLKNFAREFITALSPRIDLVDEFEGGERAFLTFCMHWRHTAPFYGIAPTGRRGTSVETLLLTIRDGKVVRVGVADNTLASRSISGSADSHSSTTSPRNRSCAAWSAEQLPPLVHRLGTSCARPAACATSGTQAFGLRLSLGYRVCFANRRLRRRRCPSSHVGGAAAAAAPPRLRRASPSAASRPPSTSVSRGDPVRT